MQEPKYLGGLARDVIEHAACQYCKENAAMGLDALGVLTEFLERTGLPDPRPPSGGPWAPEHAAPPAEAERDLAEVLTVTVSFTLPSEGTRESARHRSDYLLNDVRAAIVNNGGCVQGMNLQGTRPEDFLGGEPGA